MRGDVILCLAIAFLAVGEAPAQTTQSLISGQIVDARGGTYIAAARITCHNTATGVVLASVSDSSGFYILPLLSPGAYRIDVVAASYQAQRLEELDLPVGATLTLSFRLRALEDVWELKQRHSVFLQGASVLPFYGPDVDTSRTASFDGRLGLTGVLETTVSHAVDPRQVIGMPLNGRDVYALLLTLPGVNTEITTGRGLGISVNGQRPTASSYLLDGLENNNHLITGPLTQIAPEAIQEFRVSTSNFSAEYGGTSGFLANAVSVAGGSEWHGVGYFYLKNELLNANEYQRNAAGRPRQPLKETQPGFSVGGPLRKGNLFFSASADFFRFRSRAEEQKIKLPTTGFLRKLDPSSDARRLLERFGEALIARDDVDAAETTISPQASLDRALGISRLDWVRSGGAERVMVRLSINRFRRPNLLWSPYEEFSTPLRQNTASVGLNWTRVFRSTLANEFRAGWSRDNLRFDRPHPEIPTLRSSDAVVLPGSSAFYAYSNLSDNVELSDSLLWYTGRHTVKVGGSVFLRSLEGLMTAGRDGEFLFNSLADFAAGKPGQFRISLDRQLWPERASPNYDRQYSLAQFSLFVQDSFRATPRWVLNYGVRYENFGAPTNVGGTNDATVQLGSGSTFGERIESAQLVFPGAGDQQLLAGDNNNLAARFGTSYSLRENAETVIRGGYGIFYDRPFDNLWQTFRNNNFVLARGPVGKPFPFLQPVERSAQELDNLTASLNFPSLTLAQPNLRTPYVQSFFLGLQHRWTGSLTMEVDVLGSLGRKLITTDVVNRRLSNPLPSQVDLENNLLYFKPALRAQRYRGNQGNSTYYGMAASARYRSTQYQLHASYHWSRSLDNQSEPLAGDFFDLNFVRIQDVAGTSGAGFTRQFASSGDRANSDFDQRHHVVVLSIWDLPGGWTFAQLFTARSGFPYSVRVPFSFDFQGEDLVNNRANLVSSDTTLIRPAPDKGGMRLLNDSAFVFPAPGKLGNLGRNALRGPGFYNLDLSISRSFRLHWLSESARFVFRADAYNVLNHANLGNPVDLLGSSDFGLARFGRAGRETGFPAVRPFQEAGRQLQMMLRFEF